MQDTSPEARPRVGLLGAREEELELLAELHRHDHVDLVAVYDPDPRAVGLAVAEILGVPAGSGPEDRARLAHADVVVLPVDRPSFRDEITWCSGLRAQLVSLAEARRRWGSSPGAARAPQTPEDAAAELEQMARLRVRLQEARDLGEWLLDVAMRAVGASGGSIQLLSSETEELYLLAARGLSEKVVRTARHPVGQDIAGSVAALRRARIVHGPQPSAAGSPQRGPLTSSMVVPLEDDRGQLVGVLNVSSRIPGKHFASRDLATLQRLVPRFVRILQHGVLPGADSVRHTGESLHETLRRVAAQGRDLRDALAEICRHLCAGLGCEGAAIYLATDDGDWMQLGASDRSGELHRFPTSRSAAGRAFLDHRWVHVSERQEASEGPAAGDDIGRAVDAALSPAGTVPATRSWIYAPLVGTRPLGVLALEFVELARAEAFQREGRILVQNLALYTEARVREARDARRLDRLARLSRVVPELVEAQRQGRLEARIAHAAAGLVGARRAFFRRVDMARRTYSRPTHVGVEPVDLDAWSALDARVTQETLQRNQARITATARDDNDRLDHEPHHLGWISLPVQRRGATLGVLNVYDKSGEDVLDAYAFTTWDLEFLTSFADVVGAFLEPKEPAATGAAGPKRNPTTASEARQRPVRHPSTPPSPRARPAASPPRAPEPPSRDAPRPRAPREDSGQ